MVGCLVSELKIAAALVVLHRCMDIGHTTTNDGLDASENNNDMYRDMTQPLTID